MKTEKQLKSFRIELQKTQEQQEQRRIQQETAKVFLGTVIQRGETNTRLLKIIRLTMRLLSNQGIGFVGTNSSHL